MRKLNIKEIFSPNGRNMVRWNIRLNWNRQWPEVYDHIALFCTFHVRFSHVRVFSDSRNVQKSVTQIIYLGPLPKLKCMQLFWIENLKNSMLLNSYSVIIFRNLIKNSLWCQVIWFSEMDPAILLHDQGERQTQRQLWLYTSKKLEFFCDSNDLNLMQGCSGTAWQ